MNSGFGITQRKALRSANNMLRMGHCAPSIMQTLLDIAGIDNENLVLAAGGLAGGIAGVTMECGGVTAPLMFLGLQHDYTAFGTDSLELIKTARRYTQEFEAAHGSCYCEAISRNGIFACAKVICGFHSLLSRALANRNDARKVDEVRSKALQTFADSQFHCAHYVLENMEGDIQVTSDLLRCSWVFIGGTACQNLTCGALTAGAIALSATNVNVENSYRRVLRMIWLLMRNDENAMREEINHFNRSINLCSELGDWFQTEFGSTSCRELCGCDFSNEADVARYRTGKGISRCREIAESVTRKVRKMIGTQ
ncbi:MAG: C_GCAxxG_C_C family protein [Anaerolineae bacterium]|nr:C_GCAxxG_C_C family protein [Anaerolineae bacterium]